MALGARGDQLLEAPHLAFPGMLHGAVEIGALNPLIGRGREHRPVRRAQAENDLCHGGISLRAILARNSRACAPPCRGGSAYLEIGTEPAEFRRPARIEATPC